MQWKEICCDVSMRCVLATTQFSIFINNLGRGIVLNLLTILVRMAEKKAGCEELQRNLLRQLDWALR